MSRRKKVKNPALKKQYNLKSRQELLDFDYIDKLSESEKEFLNNFVAETVNTNFLHDDELKRLNNIKSALQNCPEISDINEHLKALKIDLSEASDASLKASIRERIRQLESERRQLKRRNKNVNLTRLKELEDAMQERRDKVLLYPDPKKHREFYTENNRRNADIYVDASKQNKMFQLDPTEFDNYYGNMVSSDVESQWLDKMEESELEEREAYVYMQLKQIDDMTCRDYIKKLDRCNCHDELYFLLEEIEEKVLR